MLCWFMPLDSIIVTHCIYIEYSFENVERQLRVHCLPSNTVYIRGLDSIFNIGTINDRCFSRQDIVDTTTNIRHNEPNTKIDINRQLTNMKGFEL